MVDFFKWVYERIGHGGFTAPLARALIVLFATAPSVLAQMQLSEQAKEELIQMLRTLLGAIENAELFVMQVLNGDAAMKQYLDRSLL
jgi:hypothetical protein